MIDANAQTNYNMQNHCSLSDALSPKQGTYS